jgi:hypothetical protein
VLAVAAVAGALGVIALSGGDGDEPPATAPVTPTTSPGPATEEAATAPDEDEETGGASEQERQVERVVRSYVEAINAKDGQTICELVPGVSEELELPEDRGSCEASIAASIGYRDPRGFPVWKSSEVERVRSIEDDTIYLQDRGHGWLLAKPSATIYRAVGYPDVPPQVLAAP